MKKILVCLLYIGATTAFSWDFDLLSHSTPLSIGTSSFSHGVTSSSGGVTTISHGTTSVSSDASVSASTSNSGEASTTCPCGWVNRNRIVGGREVQRNEYPFMVALEQGRGRQFCGGTILTPWHVLTAAHCTFGTSASQIQINAGAHNIQERSVAFHRVARIIEHERYNDNTTVNDIALLVLQSPLTFNQNIGPACLPNRRLNLVGQRIRALGWGRLATNGRSSNTLQEVDLPVISMSQCHRSWGYSPLRGPFEATNLCTFARNQDTCQGDSGGPLLWLDPDTNRYTIAALVSYGAECGGHLPAVNTDVSSYRNWINSHIRASVQGARTCTRA